MKLKALSFLVVLFFSLLVPLKTKGAVYDPKIDWYSLKTEHFRIHYPKGLEASAAAMVKISEKVYAELQPRFQWKPWGRIELVITDHTDVSNAFATTLPYNWVILYVVQPSGDSVLNQYYFWLEDVFRHELVHILHLDTVGGPTQFLRFFFGRLVTPNGLTPGWVREGLATQQESLSGTGRLYNSFTNMMLRTDSLNNEFLRIDEMSGNNFSWPSFNAGYLYGAKFWEYLAKIYGEEKLYDFSQKYARSVWVFSLNSKAKEVFGKSFYRLHQEWKAHLKQKYERQKRLLQEQGLSQVNVLKAIGKKQRGNLFYLSPSLSPDGNWLYYIQQDLHKDPELRRLHIQTKKDQRIKKNFKGEDIRVSPDGKRMVYSQIGAYKRYWRFRDLYELDLKSKKAKRLTHGERAFHPAYSPDGSKIVYVKNLAGRTQLKLYDKLKKTTTAVDARDKWLQHSHPVFSPDGQRIAVSLWEEGQRNILIFNLKGERLKQVTNDNSLDLHPQYSPDGSQLYFISDRSGISNLYVFDFKTGETKAYSNVLTGIFKPNVRNQKAYVQYYNGRGYDLREVQLFSPLKASTLDLPNFRKTPPDPLAFEDVKPPSPPQLEKELQAYEVKKYSPFTKLFIPRYVLPGFSLTDSSFLVSATTGSMDVLRRHSWTGGITYREDANFVGGFFNYSYTRYWPTLFANFSDFVVNFGDLFEIGQNYFEERRVASIGASLRGNKRGRHFFAGGYFFDNRSADSFVPEDPVREPNLGNFAGFFLRYEYSRTKRHPADIAPESGPRFLSDLVVTNKALGSSDGNEQVIFSGDLRHYFALPWNHSLALRLKGGIAFGDQLVQGTFRLGSALGEGTLTTAGPRLFPLRGLPQVTFAGERALLMSAEYRIPLLYPQRGAGTLPINLKRFHLAAFADYGTVFNQSLDFDNFLLGVGFELRADLIIGYGLPITGRIGYGIIVLGREFIQGFTDPLTGAAITNGTLILELGTSF